MNGPVPIDPPIASDAAADWLLRRQAGNNVEALAEFQAWLNGADAHRAAWHDATAVWDSFDDEPDLLLAGMRHAALAARPVRSVARPAWWALGAAAAAAIALMVHGDFQRRVTPAAGEKALATLAFATSSARRDVTLPDGSRVSLDSGTAMTAQFYPTHRAIQLGHGQAYFAVAHDSARPFTVTAMGSTVTDTGTEFNVLTRDRGMQVLLVAGAVTVGNGAQTVQLVPGDRYDSAGKRIDHPDGHALLAWRDGYLEFTGEPLGQAVIEMNRYALHPIVLHDRATAALPSLAGRFKTDDTLQFAQALADIYGLKMGRLPDGTIELRQ